MKPNSLPVKATPGSKQEHDMLWRERGPMSKKVAWAASLGDRSENADYQYNRNAWEIDRRVRYLRKCLEELTIVDYPLPGGQVFFGAWVERGGKRRG